MDISKVTGSDHLAPKPKPSSKKTESGKFGEALNKAMNAPETNPAGPAVESSLSPEKIKVIKGRINSGFYNRSDVISDIADKIIGKEKSE